MRSWLSVLITDAESKKVFDIPIAPSLYSLSNKRDNSLLAVRDINHKYIVVDCIKMSRSPIMVFQANAVFIIIRRDFHHKFLSSLPFFIFSFALG